MRRPELSCPTQIKPRRWDISSKLCLMMFESNYECKCFIKLSSVSTARSETSLTLPSRVYMPVFICACICQHQFIMAHKLVSFRSKLFMSNCIMKTFIPVQNISIITVYHTVHAGYTQFIIPLHLATDILDYFNWNIPKA